MAFQVIFKISYLQKYLRYFSDTAIIAFFKIPFTPSASVFRNNLALYVKGLKILVFAISLWKLFASSLERKHKLPVVSE